MEKAPGETTEVPKSPRRLLVFALLWTAVSLALLGGVGLRPLWRHLSSQGWPEVPCVIQRFEVSAEPGRNPQFLPDLVFQYQWEGRSYTGTRLWPETKGRDDYEKFADIREPLLLASGGNSPSPAGAKTTCRVNPGNPAEAALRPEEWDIAGGRIFAAVFFSFFVLIGVGLLVGLTVKRFAYARHPPLVLEAVFSLFATLGLGGLLLGVLPMAVEWNRMADWKEVPAEIIWSRLAKHGGGRGGPTYSIDLFYRYQFGQREYRSTRVLDGPRTQAAKSKQAFIDAHPPGAPLRVFVDPAKPWHAVVDRNIGSLPWLVLIFGAFLAMGVWGLHWVWRDRRVEKQAPPPRAPRTRQARKARRRARWKK